MTLQNVKIKIITDDFRGDRETLRRRRGLGDLIKFAVLGDRFLRFEDAMKLFVEIDT